MSAPSPVVSQVVETVETAFAGWNPEKIIDETGGDLRSLLEHAPEIFQALSTAWKEVVAKVGEMALHQPVPDAMMEMIPALDGVASQAKEVYETFKREHGQEIDQHDNPRKSDAAEKQWNR